MSTVHVINPGVVTVTGSSSPIPLRLGETFDSDDDVVREFPEMFDIVRGSFTEVEQATAAPGERRNVRRPA